MAQIFDRTPRCRSPVIEGQWTEGSGEQAVQRWLRLKRMDRSRPILVGCQNDHMAIGARQALQRLEPELGRIPVTGVDGLPSGGQRLTGPAIRALAEFLPGKPDYRWKRFCARGPSPNRRAFSQPACRAPHAWDSPSDRERVPRDARAISGSSVLSPRALRPGGRLMLVEPFAPGKRAEPSEAQERQQVLAPELAERP